MIDFSKCPQCKSKWNKYNACEKCDLIFTTINSLDILQSILTYSCYNKICKIFPNMKVWWFENESCKIQIGSKYKYGTRYSHIPMSWLPYDITEEQLKLYLTFS